MSKHQDFNHINKSELINDLHSQFNHLSFNNIEDSVDVILNTMGDSLASGGRIELRGFGSFTTHFRPAMKKRNPRTGEAVHKSDSYIPHFKPGKALKEAVDSSAL